MYRFAALLIVLAAAVPSLAQGRKFDPQAGAKAIAPFLDERTVAVVHVDLDALDAETLMKKLDLLMKDSTIKIDPAERAAQKGFLAANLDALKKNGAHDFYLIASLADLPGPGPFCVLPLGSNGNGKGIAKVFLQPSLGPGIATEEINGAVIVGSEATVKRVAKMKPTARPEIGKALTAVGDGSAHLVVVATTDSRKVLEEMMPTLPPALGGGSIKVLSRGLEWAAVKVQLEPELGVQAIVQGADKDAAKALSELLAKAYKFVGEQKELEPIVKAVPKLFDTLTPSVEGERLVLKLDQKSLVATLVPAIEEIRLAAFQMQCMNNLKQIVLAMHNYHDTFGAFPAVANFDKNGQPLLSWRVHILPFIEQQELYKQFHLDEPWDSEHNKPLIKKMPKVYMSSLNPKLLEAGKTTYVGLVGDLTMFNGTKVGVKIAEVTDGTSNTILVVDADDDLGVIWTKPDDPKLDHKDPKKGLTGRFRKGFLIAFADGSVHLLPKTITKENLNALFTKNGGEVVELPE